MLFDSEDLVTQGDNVMITLQFDASEKSEVQKTFDVLAQNGEIIMPLEKTDWSECFGLLKDKFGITWNMCQN